METVNTETVTFDLDLAWDDTDPSEGFGPLLEEISRVAPSAFVRVNRYIGSGGGWPDVTIMVARSEAVTLLEKLGYDSDDIEFILEGE